MELFVNFCEDTIFEMQLAAQISASDRDEEVLGIEEDGVDERKDIDENLATDNDDPKGAQRGFSLMVMMKWLLLTPLWVLMMIICLFSVRNMKRRLKKMTMKGLILTITVFFQKVLSAIFQTILGTVCFFLHVFYLVFLSGCIIEFAKETKLSDFFRDLPHPTLDDVAGVNEGVIQKVRGSTQTISSRSDIQAVTLDLSYVSRNPQLLTDIFGLQLRKEGGQYMLLSRDSDGSIGEVMNPSKYQVSTVHTHTYTAMSSVLKYSAERK